MSSERRCRELSLECKDLKEYSRLLEGEVEQATRTLKQRESLLEETKRQLGEERAQVQQRCPSPSPASTSAACLPTWHVCLY